MAQQISIPGCAMKLLSVVFPNIHWDRVELYVGIPTILNKNQPAITQPYFGRQRIFLQSAPDFCNLEDFLGVAHELVHVQQIQNLPNDGYVPGVFLFNYTYCFLVAGYSDAQHNCFEEEAYDFANGPHWAGAATGKLRAALQSVNPSLPCTCAGSLPLPGDVPRAQLDALIQAVRQQGAIFEHSHCSTNDCFSDLAARIGVIPAILASIFAFIASVAVFIAGFAGINGGTLPGAIVGGIGGAVVGFFAGFFAGVIAFLTGILGAILGAVLGALLGSLIADLIDAITGGDSGGRLNLESSSDDGKSFVSKQTFERSREQMALASDGDNLFVGWTGLDAQVNVLAVGQALPGQHFAKQSFEQSNHCGPALAWHDSRKELLAAWVGTEGHINVLPLTLDVATGLLVLAQKETLWGAKSPADATPSLVVAGSFYYLAFVGDPNDASLSTGKVEIWQSRDGVSWTGIMEAGSTPKTGSAALAFGSGRLYLVLQDGAQPGTVIVQSWAQDPATGALSIPQSFRVMLQSSPASIATKGGPGAAWGDDRLFITWTDPNNQIFVVSSKDGGRTLDFWKSLTPETSRGNAGPALLFVPGAPSTLFVGWTGQG